MVSRVLHDVLQTMEVFGPEQVRRHRARHSTIPRDDNLDGEKDMWADQAICQRAWE